MKNIKYYLTISAILTYNAAYPISLVSDPLYKGVVGALGALITFLFFISLYVLLKFIIRLKNGDLKVKDKVSYFISKINKLVSPNIPARKDKSLPRVDNILDPINNNNINYCNNCGKRVEIGTNYCPYCGSKLVENSFSIFRYQTPIKVTIQKVVQSLLKFSLIVVLSFIIAAVVFNLFNLKNDDYIYNIVLLTIVSYILYKIIVFAYSFSSLRKKQLGIILSIVYIVFLCLITYQYLPKEQINKTNKYGEIENEQNNPSKKINRTFLGSTFGDSYSDVTNTLIENGYEWTKVSGKNSIILTNIEYGKYKADTIYLSFFNDKFFNIKLSFNNLSKEDFENNYTYNSINDLLYKKYSLLKLGQKYNNSILYDDYYTEIKLWHKGDLSIYSSYDYKKYYVTLNYYDRTSGYREFRDKGF